LHDLAEIDALQEEFADRFGPPPEFVKNLLYQLKVRVLAEQTGIVSISVENKQLALRFPARRPHEAPRHFPNLGMNVRTSKNTVWLTNLEGAEWRSQLLTVLERIRERPTIKQKGQAVELVL
jgi:transcription-repair coupling factor (superfamily II helicase)